MLDLSIHYSEGAIDLNSHETLVVDYVCKHGIRRFESTYFCLFLVEKRLNRKFCKNSAKFVGKYRCMKLITSRSFNVVKNFFSRFLLHF